MVGILWGWLMSCTGCARALATRTPARRDPHPRELRPDEHPDGQGPELDSSERGYGWKREARMRAGERGGGKGSSRRSTLQQRAALAVRGAPEPRRAVLAARQQALAVGAQAQPVDAPAVVGADPQRRAAVPHRGRERRGAAPG